MKGKYLPENFILEYSLTLEIALIGFSTGQELDVFISALNRSVIPRLRSMIVSLLFVHASGFRIAKFNNL